MRWEIAAFQILLFGFLQLMSEADHEVGSFVGHRSGGDAQLP